MQYLMPKVIEKKGLSGRENIIAKIAHDWRGVFTLSIKITT